MFLFLFFYLCLTEAGDSSLRGDINKSTTFGTEDKCNPLEATIGAALRYQTLRSLTATEIGAGTVNVAKMVRGGSLCLLLYNVGP